MKFTGRELERARSPDADAKQLRIWSTLFEHAADRGGDVAHHGVGTFAHAGGQVDVSQTLPLRIEGGNPQVRASQIDADGEPAIPGAWPGARACW